MIQKPARFRPSVPLAEARFVDSAGRSSGAQNDNARYLIEITGEFGCGGQI